MNVGTRDRPSTKVDDVDSSSSGETTASSLLRSSPYNLDRKKAHPPSVFREAVRQTIETTAHHTGRETNEPTFPLQRNASTENDDKDHSHTYTQRLTS